MPRAKERLSRREGVNLFLKGARSFSPKEGWTKRQTRPGQHGSRPVRASAYARQLREKQKVKRMYGMRENQFRRFYENAVKIAKNTKQDKGFILLQLLETRLDNVVYLSQITRSKGEAKQMVTHGHIKVNGKRLSIPSAIVKIGDVIEISAKVKEKVAVTHTANPIPAWIDAGKGKATVKALPTRDQIDPIIKESLIVELYSR